MLARPGPAHSPVDMSTHSARYPVLAVRCRYGSTFQLTLSDHLQTLAAARQKTEVTGSTAVNLGTSLSLLYAVAWHSKALP